MLSAVAAAIYIELQPTARDQKLTQQMVEKERRLDEIYNIYIYLHLLSNYSKNEISRISKMRSVMVYEVSNDWSTKGCLHMFAVFHERIIHILSNVFDPSGEAKIICGTGELSLG